MTMPGLEVRHREGAIDGRVEGDGDDHEKRPKRLCTVRVEYHRSRPPTPGRGTERPASKGRDPRSFPRLQTSIRPRRRPRSRGSETAVGAMIFSTTGRPTRTARTSGLRATSGTA